MPEGRPGLVAVSVWLRQRMTWRMQAVLTDEVVVVPHEVSITPVVVVVGEGVNAAILGN